MYTYTHRFNFVFCILLLRLSLFDAIVRDEAKKIIPNRINFVPAFHSSLSMFDKLCNCGHYADSVMIPQLMSLLDVIRDTMLKKL